MATSSSGTPNTLVRRVLPLGLLVVGLLYIPTTLRPQYGSAPQPGELAGGTAAVKQLLDHAKAREAALLQSLHVTGSRLASARTNLDQATTAAAAPAPKALPAVAPVAVAAVPPAFASVSAAPPLGGRPCPGGCPHGTCNLDLGRCDCAPFYEGPDCATPLFPSCADQYGLKPTVAACGIHAQPSFPTTCECMAECYDQGLDARQECLVEPRPGETMHKAEARFKAKMPFMPMVANETVLAMTRVQARQAREKGLCSGNGIFAAQLPYPFYPKPSECVPEDRRYNLDECVRQRTPLCRCFPGYTGPECEVVMDTQHHLHKCFNDCSGKGSCVGNWCKCQPGEHK